MKPSSWFAAFTLPLLAACQSTPEKKPAAQAPSMTPVQARTTVRPSNSSVTPGIDSTGRVTTSSGLQYRVIESGPAGGQSPGFFDTAVVHYVGTLTDGTIFDSSLDRGAPATFGVGQVIPGWSEALRLMKPGDKWKLYIPARLAYGNRAVGDKIPPNSDLIFQVQLIQVLGGF